MKIPYQNKTERILFYIFAGAIVASFARFLVPHRTMAEDKEMFLMVLALQTPYIIVCVARIVQLNQEIKRLSIEMIVHETILSIFKPEAMERINAQRSLNKKMKGWKK